MAIIMARRSKIAVVEIHGAIGSSVKSQEMEKVLNRARQDPSFRAMVLDIDSGGGSSAPSDYIYRAVKRIAERKPVVACVRGVGASGAYMIACAAHRIVAAPGAIVGSIGVISIRPALEQLFERAGIGVNVNKSGKFKDMGAPWREMTPEENEKIQELIDDSYDSFVKIVAESRDMDEDRVRDLATGEVYLAPRGLEVGLVDELGDLDRALELASSAAGVPKRPMHLRPPRGLRARLLGPVAETFVESVSEHIEKRLLQGRHGL